MPKREKDPNGSTENRVQKKEKRKERMKVMNKE
jgi:hypothetical protein